MFAYAPKRCFTPPALALTLALALLFGGCERGLAPPEKEEGRAIRTGAPRTTGQAFIDDEAGIRFQIPSGMAVETEHYPGVTEPGVIRHMFTLTAEQKERLRVELWLNPGRIPLAPWLQRHLDFMRDGLARESWGPVAEGQVRGVHFVWPRSGQSTGQHIVLFSLEDKIIRVTCQDGQDPALAADFKALVASLALLEHQP